MHFADENFTLFNIKYIFKKVNVAFPNHKVASLYGLLPPSLQINVNIFTVPAPKIQNIYWEEQFTNFQIWTYSYFFNCLKLQDFYCFCAIRRPLGAAAAQSSPLPHFYLGAVMNEEIGNMPLRTAPQWGHTRHEVLEYSDISFSSRLFQKREHKKISQQIVVWTVGATAGCSISHLIS